MNGITKSFSRFYQEFIRVPQEYMNTNLIYFIIPDSSICYVLCNKDFYVDDESVLWTLEQVLLDWNI